MSAFMVRSLPSHILSLSDEQLYEKMRSYLPNVGPVLPSTRCVYERKLYALETGQDVEAVSNFSSADDDEDDEPQTSRTPPPSQPRSRSTVSQRAEHPIERSKIGQTYARRPLHSGIGDPPSSRFPARARKGTSPANRAGERAQPAPSGGHWLWLLLLFVGAVVALTVYVAISNMEANPESNFPDRIDMQQD